MISSIAVDAGADVMERVGQLLVTVRRNGTAEQLEVYDLSDPEHPRKTASRMTSFRDDSTEGLWPMVMPHGLVLEVAPEPKNDGGASVFRVVDVSDPEHPRISDEIAVPGEDRARFAFADGTNVYYAYTLLDSSEPDPAHAQFYFRRIDVADPDAPKLEHAVRTPGVLLAARGERLYSRELSGPADHPSVIVHRFSVHDGQAQIEASYAMFGAHWVEHLDINDQGDVVAQVNYRITGYHTVDPSGIELDTEWESEQLIVLDGDGLEPRGPAIGLNIKADRLMVRHDRGIYETEKSIEFVDVHGPTLPTCRATS